jgi:hypothetical protein
MYQQHTIEPRTQAHTHRQGLEGHFVTHSDMSFYIPQQQDTGLAAGHRAGSRTGQLDTGLAAGHWGWQLER